MADITIPAETYFPSYKGFIDGNGHKLIVATPPMTVQYRNNSEFAVFGQFTGTIKNLDFETNGFKALIYNALGDVIINNVDAYGEMNGADTNVGPYVLFPRANSNVSFIGCNNYVNIIDKMGGKHYGAAFIGGFMDTNTESISFTNCNNYGTLFFGQDAGFLMGNPHQIDDSKIKVENCYNYGLIQAFNSVGGISWPNHLFNDSNELSKYNKNNGKIEKQENTITSFSVDSDGTPKVEIGNATQFNLKYVLQFNIGYNVKATGASGGNRNMSIEFELGEDGKLPTSIVEIKDNSQKHESIVDGTLYIDPYAYDFSSEIYEVSSFPTKITYYVLDVNESNGLFNGMASTKIK